jgi:RNA polymerase sigma-70 factor (ECF subfamily)
MTLEPSRSTQLQECLDRLRAGDDSARVQLLAGARGRLTRLARKMLRGHSRVRRWEETDDVFQNAILRLDRALRAVPPSTVREFIGLAALQIRRELTDLARHHFGPQGQGRHYDTPRPGVGQIEPADSTQEPERLAVWGEFHRLIDELPAEEREAFDLLWYQGLSQVESATLLGVSERTLQRRWQSARLHLRAALKDDWPDRL